MNRPLGALLRTSGFRLACIGAGFAGLGALIVFSVIYYGTLMTMRRALDANVVNETKEILVEGPATPLALVESKVRRELAEHSTRDFYLLVNKAGVPLTGDLDIEMPSAGWHDLDAPSGRPFAKGVTTLRALVVVLPGSARLLVAADTTILKRLDGLIRRSFLLGFGITLGIGLVAGVIFGRRALARVESVSAASRQIMAGDLSRRIPLAGTDDEFDRLAQTVNTMLERIEQLMENLRAVGEEIAHDMRSPLGRLRETLELALRVDDRSVLRNAVEESITQTDSALRLCSAILRLAQIASGERRASFRSIDLSLLLSHIADTYEAVAEEAGDRLDATIEEGLKFTGDAALLNQLFANLIENAIKHASPAAEIVLRAWSEPGAIITRIEDNGPGIPMDCRAKALRRFGRLDSARRTSGHGLGLPLAAAIADLHDATMSLGEAHPGAKRSGLAVTLRFVLPTHTE